MRRIGVFTAVYCRQIVKTYNIYSQHYHNLVRSNDFDFENFMFFFFFFSKIMNNLNRCRLYSFLHQMNHLMRF